MKNNLLAGDEIDLWKKKNPDCSFRLYAVDLGQPSIKGWGVGLARKTGMDEAARRFNSIHRPEGVIACLDADCTIQDNYFTELENELLKKKERGGCSVYFEHPVTGVGFTEEVYNSVYQYELHLRYYYQALKYTLFPHVFHTVGSSMAVKCLTYIKVGGMNRRQAGEDFYFIQKLVSAGGYFNLNSTTVYPSPRPSGRVPFGTGAAVGKMLAERKTQFMTYNPLAFKELSVFFGLTETMYNCKDDGLNILFEVFPVSVKLFLRDQEWVSKISEIKNNTSGYFSFRKRFFDWFNMFKVVKYLNFSHELIFRKVPVVTAAEEMLKYINIAPVVAKAIGLLHYYRTLEKGS